MHLLSTYHMRVITISEKLLNRNIVSYKVALTDNSPIDNVDNNTIVNTPFVLFQQSDFLDQTLRC